MELFFKNILKILLLSFYYPPDIGPGSLRAKSIVDSLIEESSDNLTIDVLTAMPNRYNSYNLSAKKYEENKKLYIHRIKILKHKNKMFDQVKSYIYFSFTVLKFIKNKDYDIIVATSSRLMTAVLGAYIAKKKNSRLYLDIRDLFADTMNSLFKKNFLGFLLPILNLLEKWTFESADKINIVSGGFLDYFDKFYPKINPTIYTNGIDDYFLNYKFTKDHQNKNYKILYAGNIGEGQGLDKIIPKAASENQNLYFKIIGDGSSRKLLTENKYIKSLNNVEVIDPISREDLIKEYEKADILFIHLNDYKAFHRVLPSKIFEYAALNKPILAGVSGYAAKFLRNYIPDTEIFDPCDHEEMKKCIVKIIKNKKLINRSDFILKFRRKNIMKKLAKDILSLN